MNKVMCILGLFLGIAACSSDKTVSYYVEHPEEMKAKIEECNDDAAKMFSDPRCTNAVQARVKKRQEKEFVIKDVEGPALPFGGKKPKKGK